MLLAPRKKHRLLLSTSTASGVSSSLSFQEFRSQVMRGKPRAMLTLLAYCYGSFCSQICLMLRHACRLILVDAHALLYRSHFGFKGQRLETSGGEDTSISYGFLSTVLRLLEIQEPPTHFAVVMDHHGKTFRCIADPALLPLFLCATSSAQ